MLPSSLFQRLPPATVLLLLASLSAPTNAHVLPRRTTTLEHRTLDVLPWPPLPTAAAISPDEARELLRRQDFNTVCGFIGGDPALPATCSAGSHCVVEPDLGAVGCCPNGGACTTGIFTGCVDFNSGPQTVLNPLVFTCQGSDVCFQNVFAGGFSQFGCGTASSLATTVETSISALISALIISSVSAEITAELTTLSEPTTINPSTGTVPFTSSNVTPTSSATTETTSTTPSSTSTSTTTSTTSRSTSSSTSRSTSKTTSSSSTSATPAPATEAPEQPDSDIDRTGAIIGGTISGVAILIALVAVGYYLWRRKQGNTRVGPGNQPTQYISPMSHGPSFAPVATSYENYEAGMPHGGTPGYPQTVAAPLRYNPTYGYGADAAGGMVAAAAPPILESDRVPLTREIDDFSRSFNDHLGSIREEDERAAAAAAAGTTTGTTDERPLWQQNRRQSRNMMWM